MRTAQSWLAASFLCLAAGCSYDAISAPVTLRVDNVPANAVRIEATLSDSASHTTAVNPHFGPGVFTAANPLLLAFPPPASGPFTISVKAFDDSSVQIGSTATQSGDFPTQVDLDVALAAGP